MKLHQKLSQKKRMVINKGNGSKELNEVKPVKNKNKNPERF